jgi:2-octaprenyl-6-methoxyphenol hydroxylase
MMQVYDVAIVGGGLVGGSLACALRGSGLDVAVLEASPAAAPAHPSYDERVIALALGSRRIFDGIGLWGAIAADAEPIRHIHVSDRGHFGVTRLDADDEGVEALGYVAPARSIGQAIERCVAKVDPAGDRCDLLRPARVLGLRRNRDAWRLEVAIDGASRLIDARLLVAADGGDSMVRRRLGLGVHERPYGYSAVISTLMSERPQRGTAFERFTDTGPLAMLPMTGGRYSVVWTARTDDSARILRLDDQAFIDAVQQRFGQRLGALRQPGRRIAYPLRLVLAKRIADRRVVLLGNAAHTLHPVAGQGFNLGLRDVAEIAELLYEAARTGRDAGGSAVVDGYRRRRRADQLASAMLTDTLARLFVNPWGPVRFARNLGLIGLELCPPARHRLARQFMGAAGRQTRLATGVGR